jgi:predicted PurR-regulated permease PerM
LIVGRQFHADRREKGGRFGPEIDDDVDERTAHTAEELLFGMRRKLAMKATDRASEAVSRVVDLAHREIDAVLGEFLRGQLSVMAIMAVFYALGLWLVGVEYAVAIGLLTGLVVFIPYVGAVFGITLGTLVALMQFEAIGPVFWVWAVFGAGQLVEGYVVVPRLVGDRIGLHPVLVIFSLMAFGQLFGFVGVLLALPASAALLVWLRYLRTRYLDSALYRA